MTQRTTPIFGVMYAMHSQVSASGLVDLSKVIIVASSLSRDSVILVTFTARRHRLVPCADLLQTFGLHALYTSVFQHCKRAQQHYLFKSSLHVNQD